MIFNCNNLKGVISIHFLNAAHENSCKITNRLLYYYNNSNGGKQRWMN